EDYKAKRLDAVLDEGRKPLLGPEANGHDAAADPARPADPAAARADRGARRRRYLREYFRWLEPDRFAVTAFVLLSVLRAGLEMIEPLFMRFIVDRVLLNKALAMTARLERLNLIGTGFLTLIVASNLLNAFKENRQRLLNTRLMLALRRALFERML